MAYTVYHQCRFKLVDFWYRKAVQLLAYIASQEPKDVPVSQLISHLPNLLKSDSLEVREATASLILKLSANGDSHDALAKVSFL